MRRDCASADGNSVPSGLRPRFHRSGRAEGSTLAFHSSRRKVYTLSYIELIPRRESNLRTLYLQGEKGDGLDVRRCEIVIYEANMYLARCLRSSALASHFSSLIFREVSLSS